MLRINLLAFIFFLYASNAFPQFIFRNLSEDDGLNSRQVNCLYKDRDGFLWMGTSTGLNRFDGNLIQPYKNPKGQSAVYINSISPIDADTNLLLATNQGLKIFSKSARTFIKDDRFAVLENKIILALKLDGYGRLWIIGPKEIYIFKKGKLFSLNEIIPDCKILANHNFTFSAKSAFCWDSSRNGFWVGGWDCFFIDCKSNKIYSKSYNPLKYLILNKPFVSAIAVDKSHNIWYSSNSDTTLNYWNTKSQSVSIVDKIEGKKLLNGFNYIFIDSKNQLWLSGFSYSAYFKEEGKPIIKIPYGQDEPNSISYGHFFETIEDSDGNLLFATINGLSINLSQNPVTAIFKLPSFDFVRETGFAIAVAVAINKKFIVAAKEDGIVFYDVVKRSFQRYVVSKKINLQRNHFNSLAYSDSRWWFAGANGVYTLKSGTGTLKKFSGFPKARQNRSANFIFEDKTKNVWFHVENDALYRYNPKSKKCHRFDGTDSQYGTFKYKECQSYLKLRNGDLLFTMDGVGFLKYNITSETFSTIPVANLQKRFVRQIVEDQQGYLWISVYGKGLLKLDRAGNYVDSLNTSNGLPYDYVGGLTIDSRGAIWASSQEGLIFFFPDAKKITRVKINLGKTLQDFWDYLTVANDKIYAVMLDHIVVIDPSRFEKIKVRKAPHITSVKILQKEVVDVETKKPLMLSHDQDFVTFQFASLYHRDIPALHYSYQLDGIDEDWVNSQRSVVASYNHLPPGKYTFKVRSTDENGKWMSDISIQPLIILPPWWQSWWFRTLMITLLAFSLWTLYINHLRRRQRILSDKTIDYFANSVYGENSVDEICWDIARNCATYLHFEDCSVYLIDQDRRILVKKADYSTIDLKDYLNVGLVEVEMGKGIIGTVARTGTPLINLQTDGGFRNLNGSESVTSKISVPIYHEGEVIGIVYSEHRKKGFFRQEHIKTLMTIASISANKIAEAQAEEKTQQKEIMLLEINKMLAESQLMALRAQMNPHFVFNCLNSIQECIVTEKYREASKYLNKFSKLFRTVLNNSDKNLVTIEEEIEVLDLYLQLEQMRFEQSFTYKIILDDELEAEEIVLPSMLLQPYVENALWHGLMHKHGDRKLFIKFQRMSDDIFKCVIEDNGIGRKKSFEIKEQSVKARIHKSKGLQIAKDRLDLLQRQGQHASVNIIDKYGPDGAGIGTTVDIELSTFLKTI